MRVTEIELNGRTIPVASIARSQTRKRCKLHPRLLAVQLDDTSEIVIGPDPGGRIEQQLLLTTFCLEPEDLLALA